MTRWILLAGTVLGCAAPIQRAPKDLLPSNAEDVQPRGRADIFEQVNGGSVTFLDNGMVDAVFAVVPHADEDRIMDLEIYRFETGAGAAAQFEHLHGGEGGPWESAAKAVRHDYGVELVRGPYVVRVTWNAGDPREMKERGDAAARGVLGQLGAER